MKNKVIFFASLLFIVVACHKSSVEPVLSYEAQLAVDIELIDTYLKNKGLTATNDPSGLRYIFYKTGGTQAVKADNCVIVSYLGKFLSDDKTFDSGTAFQTPVKSVINGWVKGLQLMHKGDSAVFYIPSGLAYGSKARTGIPANSILYFGIKVNMIGTSFEYNPANGTSRCIE